MTIDWKTAPDAEKNAAIAQYVAGWTDLRYEEGENVDIDAREIYPWEGIRGTVDGKRRMVTNYLHYADAVIALLDKHFEWSLMTDCETHVYEIRIGFKTRYIRYQGLSRSFCEAACIALLRAADVEVLT